jgi:hypothetical protein
MSYTSAQQILLPESTMKQRRERKITVAVNSRDRNLTANYFSNNFRWEFRRPLKDIKSIELVNGSIPADLYNVTPEWNKFTFAEDGASLSIVALTPGQYTAAQLATQLATQLNAVPGKLNTYAVAYSSITKVMTITGTGSPTKEFTFYFKSGTYRDDIDVNNGSISALNCPAKLFGFEFWDYTSVSGVLVAPRRADPDYPIKHIYLHINADNSMEINRIETGAGRHDCFHILYMNQLVDGYYYINQDTYIPIFYSAPAPIARMSALYISIRDEFFRLIDLGNHDFTLVFEITVLD